MRMPSNNKALKLKRLDGAVAAQKFDIFYPYIIKGLTGVSDSDSVFLKGNFQKAVLSGMIRCWLAYTLDEDEEEFDSLVGVITTSIVKEPLTGVPVLLIYTIGGETDSRGLLPKFYRQGFEQLKEYAKESNCKKIVFYTE